MEKRINKLTNIGNLPNLLSTFIGRANEVAKVSQLIITHRLVTLTGTGGSGKTRLALKAAQKLEKKFKNGIWFVDLTALGDASLIPDKIVSTLNINKRSKETILDSLITYLSMRQILLILDNCEHLITICAEITESLLQKCPNLHILSTSREMLGIPSEMTWVVSSLSLPNQHSTLRQVQASESVQLFIDRAVLKNPDFKLTIDNFEAIAEICNRLDGMPLAIELAAAQVRSLSPQEIAQRLNQRFHFLTSGSRNAPVRQQTLLATIDWSYALLTTKEQVMLQRLSIFMGGTSLQAVEAICVGGEIESTDVLETILHLTDKSLITANSNEHGETRYRLLETIREYAQERLGETQEKVNIQNNHLKYFVQLAKQGNQKIKGIDQLIWYERLEVEQDNIRMALQWALESMNIESGLRLSTELAYFWFTNGNIRENIIWLEKLLDQKQDIPADLEGWAYLALGVLLEPTAKYENNTNDLLFEKGLHLFREVDDHHGIAFALNLMGVIALQKGELVRAEQLLNESLVLRKELGDPWSIAQTLQNFPPLAMQKNELKKAREYAEETIHWFEQAGDQRNMVRSLIDFADIARLEGNFTHAVALLTQVLSQVFQFKSKVTVVNVLESLVVLTTEQREFKRASILHGSAEALREELGMQGHGLEYAKYLEAVTTIRKKLSDSIFNQNWSKGHAMPLEKVVDYVVGKINPSSKKLEITSEEKVWFQLSPRERDVMRLLADGYSNLEISQKLVLSEKTIRNYISNIYRKLQITSRGEMILLARKLISSSEE